MDIKANHTNDQANYHDTYYAKGHLLTKIWQTLMLIISWIIFLIPCVVTTSTYVAYRTHGKFGFFFWHYQEGFRELNFLLIILTFALGMFAVFCLTTSYIQKQRHQGLVTKWPMFDISANRRGRERAEAFISQRFGDQKSRQQVRYYVVRPEQNLSNNQLKRVIAGKDED